MSGDRFDDLGPKQPARPAAQGKGSPKQPARPAAQGKGSAGEKLAERDRTHPEPAGPPEVPRPGNKYAWVVGILMLMGLGVLLFAQTLPNQGEGLEGPEPGMRVKAFAAPAALGDLEGDANVCQREPCPEGAGAVPACELEGEGIVTVCPRRSRPLVLTFVVTRGTDCEPQVDRAERVRRELPEVDFVTVVSGDSHEEAEGLARSRGWGQPVAVDEDGAVVNLYGIGICPVTVFSRDGRVRETGLGNLTEDQLRRKARRLVR
ncbi:MAG: TlpA family protein disulfide reductase [Thermoleophilaceae bacterium]